VVGIVAAAVMACLIVGLLVCGGLVYLGMAGISSREPTSEEKMAVVTIRDLEPYGVEIAEVESREVWKTKRNVDGSLEIEYEYDPDLAPGPGDKVILQGSVDIEHTEKDARQTFSLNIMASQTGMRIYGATTRDQQHTMADVDQSYFALVMKNEKPVGNLVSVRKGKHVYGLLVINIYFDDPHTLEEMLREKIDQGERSLTEP
jgi:hypothetical protein